ELGMRAAKLTIGPRFDRWPPRPPLRRRPDAPLRILRVGSINRVKDYETLIQALALVKQQTPFEAEIVGIDLMEGSIQKMTRDLGLDDVVKFHGDLPHSRARSFFERADVHVVTSLHEADPIAFLEADRKSVV